MLCRRLIACLLILGAWRGSFAPAQTSRPEGAQPATAPTTAPTTAPALALADLATQSDQTAAALRTIDATLSANSITQEVEDQIGPLTQETSARLEETERQLSPGPSLETLRSLESDWIETKKQVGTWIEDLTKRQKDLKAIDAQLVEMQVTWRNTLNTATAINVSADVENGVKALLARIDQRRTRISNEQLRLTAIQNRVIVENSHVEDALQSVREASTRAWNRLLGQDSPPLWSALLNKANSENLSENSRNSFNAQWTTLRVYVQRHSDSFLLHLAVMAALAAGLIWMRRRAREWTANDPAMRRAALILQMPVAVAMVVTVIFSAWIYPQAPRLFWAIFGTLALLPTIYVLRRLVEKPLIPVFYALAVWCFVSLIVSVTASMPALSRLIFVVQMVGGTAFFVWFLRSTRRHDVDQSARLLWRVTKIGGRIVIAVTSIAAIANIFGYVSLSRLLGAAIFTGAYLGVLLDATVRVIDAMLLGASHLYPLAALGMVRRHRDLLLRRAHWLIVFAAAVLWAYFTLESVSLRYALMQHVHAVLNAPWTAVKFPNLTLGGILYFFIVIAAAYFVSRFINFVLDEDVYPRVPLARGVPYAISTLLRYVILLVGFIAAVASLGYPANQLTILGSAFTLGIGFGLQNIVNNFVSGLILLFERPVQVGDVIQVDDQTGVVARIGIRASVIRTSDAAEIIVPNGNLISSRVINWTLSNRQRGVQVPLSVSSEADPQRVIDLLIGVAKAQPMVAASPTPQAYVTDFMPGGMKFELRVWTNRYEDWTRMKSDLTIAINAMVQKEKLQLK